MEDSFKAGGVTQGTTWAAYKHMQLHAAKQYNASFVFNDMGPSSDIINMIVALSADIIQPCVCPDAYSWNNAMSLIIDVLPDWMLQLLAHRKKLGKVEGMKFNQTFPKVMPFMAMQVKLLSSKTIKSFRVSCSVHTLRL